MQIKDARKRPTGLWIMMLTVIVVCLFISNSFAAEEKVIKVLKGYPAEEDYTAPAIKWYGEGTANPIWKRPDLNVIGMINKENVEQHKDSLPVGVYLLIKEWGMVANIIPTEPTVFKGSSGYIAASEKTSKSGCKVNAEGSLENYMGGLPFANPKTGTEAMWNFHYRYYGDNACTPYTTRVLERKGGSRVVGGNTMMWHVEPRYDMDPIPGYPNNTDKLDFKEMDTSTYPPEVNGLNVLLLRYQGAKEDDMWMYVPTMRRVRRFSTAQRCDSYGGSHHTYDDFWVYNGKLQNQTYKMIAEKDMYNGMQQHIGIARRGKEWGKWNDPRVKSLDGPVPALPGTLSPPDFNGTFKQTMANCQNVLLAKRATYVVEATPKDPKYLYSKRVLYIDKETNQLHISDCYDRNGQLWKHFLWLEEIWPELAPGKGALINVHNSLAIDLIGEEGDFGGEDHPTVQNWSSTPGLPYKDFSIEGLRRMGH